MSTTDRVPFSKPCPCGGGEVHYVHCSPDHPYASTCWIEDFEIRCVACASQWELVGNRLRPKREPAPRRSWGSRES